MTVNLWNSYGVQLAAGYLVVAAFITVVGVVTGDGVTTAVAAVTALIALGSLNAAETLSRATELSGRTRTVAEGNLNQPVEFRADDEFGEIAGATETLRQSLNDRIEEMEQAQTEGRAGTGRRRAGQRRGRTGEIPCTTAGRGAP